MDPLPESSKVKTKYAKEVILTSFFYYFFRNRFGQVDMTIDHNVFYFKNTFTYETPINSEISIKNMIIGQDAIATYLFKEYINNTETQRT